MLDVVTCEVKQKQNTETIRIGLVPGLEVEFNGVTQSLKLSFVVYRAVNQY